MSKRLKYVSNLKELIKIPLLTLSRKTKVNIFFLKKAYLRDVYLRGANLMGVNLSFTDLRGAYLIDVNLSGANLKWANLMGSFYNDGTIFPEGFKIQSGMIKLN